MALTGNVICAGVLKTCDGANCLPTTTSAWREDAEGYTASGALEVRVAGSACLQPPTVVVMSAATYNEVVAALQEQPSMELVVFAILAVIYFLGVAVGLRAIQPRTGGFES